MELEERVHQLDADWMRSGLSSFSGYKSSCVAFSHILSSLKSPLPPIVRRKTKAERSSRGQVEVRRKSSCAGASTTVYRLMTNNILFRDGRKPAILLRRSLRPSGKARCYFEFASVTPSLALLFPKPPQRRWMHLAFDKPG